MTPVFSPFVIIWLNNFSLSLSQKKLKRGRDALLDSKPEFKSSPGNTKYSLSLLKPDAVNAEQAPPRQCGYEIPVSFMPPLSVFLTFPFFSYSLIFPTIYQMWAGTSHFIYNLSLFGSINLGIWNSCLLLAKAPHLLVLSDFFYRA